MCYIGERSKNKGGIKVTNESLEELFALYGDDVFRLALSYLGNVSDAEDVCQNVFIKLAEQALPPDKGKEKHWLLKCTANACKNILRSVWRKNREELSEELPALEEREREVRNAVMSLPPKYRAAVHLFYFEGYSQGEIADILHISVTAVQTRMCRAREMLKKELK